MVYIETTATLESFRRFLINNTCRSFIPESYLRDKEVFPEKEGDRGAIYVEAADKVTLKKIRDVTFINAKDVLGIIYISKSGNSRLKWRQLRGTIGKITGEASANSVASLIASGAISKEYAETLAGLKEGLRQTKKEKKEETEEI
ncbi:MAG: hypothetical protein QXY08_01875 [Nitrososphaerales archaeon]